ncbi:MAG: glucose-6-phosphate dehydrogenase [Myxococcaceae bacterium]|nr:glucose-6-phosphate dehydrogenase [Myxococcaceae bacterium]MBH2005781.1 glucose-6-phosphate dehydrogenase [Myxococcaceae bacterium]
MKATDCQLVILGAGGDLTKRLLLPALCNLGAASLLPDHFSLFGVARTEQTPEAFRNTMKGNVESFVSDSDSKAFGEKLMENTHFISGDLTQESTFQSLKLALDPNRNHIFYLAVPPQFFLKIIKLLGQLGLVDESNGFRRRVIIEKPFGRDLESAQKLNADILRILQEHQIFRIDHYLGKETVQNLLAFRFANGIFEPIWNRRYIDHVQITVAESLGVELRGNYYETAGALRDMVPNHIFQLLSYVGMEPPISLDADAVRDEKSKLLRAIQPLKPEDVIRYVVRGQYREYRSSKDVKPDSNVETFVALRLMVDNWRWAGVPFYLRTGKRMPQRATEIAIQFKTPPAVMFKETQVENLSPNLLVVHIQPEEGISLRFGAKVPGPVVKLEDVNMKFQYRDYFGSRPGTGYEALLYDCMMGDSTLFQRADMVETGWRVVQPILDVWNALPPRDFPNYGSESWGPQEASELMEREGRKWRNII